MTEEQIERMLKLLDNIDTSLEALADSLADISTVFEGATTRADDGTRFFRVASYGDE